MTDFGVTPSGFVLKPVDVLLDEAIERARSVFPGADLTTTSALRKILETTAAEDGELWKRLEDLYFGNFMSTATGDALDQLGEDVGVARRQLASTGTVRITLDNPAAGERHVLPEGTVVVTGEPVRAFGTVAPVTLDTATRTADVDVVAFGRGPDGDVDAGAITAVDPAFQAQFLTGTARFTVTNRAATTGGTGREPDESYRNRLLGLARNLWTVDAVAQAALGVDGVVDVVLSDPLGGVDVSQSLFDLFNFDQRAFSSERRVGEPYFFTVVVAHDPLQKWHTVGPVEGIFERVTTAVDAVRPIGIHANVVEADHIEVGVRATAVIASGSDGTALLSSIRRRLAADIGALRLGGDVLYSQVVRAFVEQPGVLDVQNLHLRRSPAAFGRITFGDVPFQRVVAEAAVGENLAMGPTELATFVADGDTLDVTLVIR
ncbi:baseplate J/gp47 family protein [Amycolatopsis sp. Hca4]|uniref:baseplate J/gp47 family protein n=1 Tax=Amycolatopsis sp. Hca4 TaxID=2742131 RepID=UPI001591C9EA|nr:baseplate J/gp47 family protein [Amycolatopsis sp. Hca4]QKV80427.1 baseplate J/gp47 family protein [Amycolatopsis sp. Hca4]